MSEMFAWIQAHKSANFFWVIILVAIVLLLIGLFLGTFESSTYSFFSTFLIQLSGAGFATAFLSFFLSFSDIKRILSDTIYDLWIDGEVVNSLSIEIKEKIDKKILISSSSNEVKNFEDSLYRSLTNQRLKCLTDFFLTSYNNDILLTEFEKDPNYLIRRVKCSYRAHASHIKDKEKKFPLRYDYEISLPKDIVYSIDDVFLNFYVIVNDEKFGKEHVKVTKKNKGSFNAFLIQFEKELIINEYADIILEIESLANKNVNDFIIMARYPTNGCKVALQFTEDCEYDSCWFIGKYSEDVVKYSGSRQYVKSDGISVSNNNWILPGNGLSICWYPKIVKN